MLLTIAVAVQASPRYQRAFVAKYPKTTGTKLAQCQTCHLVQPPAVNPYGLAFKAAHFKFEPLEPKDSDKDGATNLAEITALTFPGKPADKPKGTADSTAAPDSTSTDSTAKPKPEPEPEPEQKPDSTKS
ncbi:MAG TPA: hypothetical protein VEY91_10995 [Candidatus Limnocylindria bacterium]|nr:hypothetical protein [Candidatus Limnocylindria bacterium]